MTISDIKEKILANTWKPLKLFTYQYKGSSGKEWEQTREVYDKGDGAAVLMYNKAAKKIVLTKQFRMPAYINGLKGGIVTEVPAGMLDKDDPETCIIREIEEETGYKVPKVIKVRDCFMTPGAVTEITHMFIAAYDETMKVANGGGLENEQEDILVFEMSFEEAKRVVENNEIKDAKTLILLQYAWIHHLLEA
ncbi:nudix-type nucleoside diphosphatase (YffH/AdpP family) [Wenyingzhuangia heitensis]|uniref:GDP-mannose pyrophosphatase n=1 Tax=Wenyingzhuangia heitensis TaxID=1487859 RepID=A0ABX0UE22_9FLAO|nr:NUDIX domain-containing protein [Wenyingzhuangia heitensis]NIJ45302.1 nudix-type nucleoside diphosphatase (YffH/AdpP family) [Wenyingzhuangia heitensis]